MILGDFLCVCVHFACVMGCIFFERADRFDSVDNYPHQRSHLENQNCKYHSPPAVGLSATKRCEAKCKNDGTQLMFGVAPQVGQFGCAGMEGSLRASMKVCGEAF